jgi:chromosome segregation ATPase
MTPAELDVKTVEKFQRDMLATYGTLLSIDPADFDFAVPVLERDEDMLNKPLFEEFLRIVDSPRPAKMDEMQRIRQEMAEKDARLEALKAKLQEDKRLMEEKIEKDAQLGSLHAQAEREAHLGLSDKIRGMDAELQALRDEAEQGRRQLESLRETERQLRVSEEDRHRREEASFKAQMDSMRATMDALAARINTAPAAPSADGGAV